MSWEWIYLILAIVSEIIFGLTLKSTVGLTRFLPSLVNIAALGAGLYFLSVLVKFLPITIVYPIWTGLGGVGVAVFSLFFYEEELSLTQIFCIFLIIAGAVGLKLGEMS
ncbi:MAG: SMR family transporter [Oscillatoria sp. PMC 1068.18]|nr:SMR family transporter [Oscillatoria sp. PMC 1068.18]